MFRIFAMSVAMPASPGCGVSGWKINKKEDGRPAEGYLVLRGPDATIALRADSRCPGQGWRERFRDVWVTMGRIPGSPPGSPIGYSDQPSGRQWRGRVKRRRDRPPGVQVFAAARCVIGGWVDLPRGHGVDLPRWRGPAGSPTRWLGQSRAAAMAARPRARSPPAPAAGRSVRPRRRRAPRARPPPAGSAGSR
jgi:hypothetical protein